MKKGKLTLGIVLGLLVFGFVVAQTQAVSAQDSATDAVVDFKLGSNGCFCLDLLGWCNDAKLCYQSMGGGIYALTGYEYGCGYDDRLITGSMRVVGNTLQIGYVTICAVSCTPPKLGQTNAQINLGTLTGPVQWAWHFEGYQYGPVGTAKILFPCPVTAAVSGEPDSGE